MDYKSSNRKRCQMLGKYLIILAVIPYAEQLSGPAVSDFFNIATVTDVVETSIVAQTYETITTTIACGVECSRLSSVSFYFIRQSSTCHCNSNLAQTLELSSGQGSIKYGYLGENALQTTTTTTTTTTTANLLPSSCDQFSDGWIPFQRRMDGSVDFYRNWTDYVNGFGYPNDGEFWLGLETIHQKTTGNCQLCIYLVAGPNNYTSQEDGYAMYSYFNVESVDTGYRLIIDGFSGTVGDSLNYHNGSSFSTFDYGDNFDCAELWKGGWWYIPCYYVHLTGPYLNGYHAQLGGSVEWKDPWGHYFSLKFAEMSFRCETLGSSN